MITRCARVPAAGLYLNRECFRPVGDPAKTDLAVLSDNVSILNWFSVFTQPLRVVRFLVRPVAKVVTPLNLQYSVVNVLNDSVIFTRCAGLPTQFGRKGKSENGDYRNQKEEGQAWGDLVGRLVHKLVLTELST